MQRFIDMTGRRFDKLVVIGRAQNSSNNSARWLLRCECGNVIEKDGVRIRKGIYKSCGCDDPKSVPKKEAAPKQARKRPRVRRGRYFDDTVNRRKKHQANPNLRLYEPGMCPWVKSCRPCQEMGRDSCYIYYPPIAS